MLRRTALLSLLSLTCYFTVQSASAEDPKGYLALGDSLPFGFSPLVPLGDLSQYHGYPQIVADAVHRKLANASCFGETSSHFLNLSAQDLGCQAWRATFPLFVSYSGTQMDYATQYLHDHRKTELVTIDIGINDLVVLLANCNGNIPCALAGFPTVVATYQSNLTTIYGNIRGGSAPYTGPIVAVTGYSVDYSTQNQVQTGAIATMNSFLAAVTTAFGGKVADAFTAFGAAAGPSGNVCQTGLLIRLPDGTCDTHPSAAGQALIAQLILDQIGDKLK